MQVNQTFQNRKDNEECLYNNLPLELCVNLTKMFICLSIISISIYRHFIHTIVQKWARQNIAKLLCIYTSQKIEDQYYQLIH